MYTLQLGYFGKGLGRSCDWSWGLQVWAAGSCLSDSDPLPDPGKPESPAVLGTAFTPLPASFHGDGNPAWGRDVAENNTGKRGQSQSLGVNLPPLLHGTPVAGPLTVPRAVLEVPPFSFTAVPPPSPALCLGQSSPGTADPQPGAGSRWRQRLSADPVSPGLSSLNASNACQKYLCGTWKVNFSFPFFNSWGGRVTGCEKGRWGGCASLASEWAGREAEQKISLLPDFNTL